MFCALVFSMPSPPKQIRPTARLLLRDSRRTWNTTAPNRQWIHSVFSVPTALYIWTTIMLTRRTKMSRLRHVYIFVLQVTSKVRDMWCGTTSAVENWSCLRYREIFWITSQCAAAQQSTCRIYLHLLRPGLTILQNYLPPRKISAIYDIDPSSDNFSNNQVRLDAAEITQLASDIASSPQMATIEIQNTPAR